MIGYVERERAVYMPTFRRQHIVLDHGHGCYVWDIDGVRYLDLVAGIAVNVLGHAHPELLAAIQTQAAKLIHTSNLYYTVPQVEFAELVTRLTLMEKVFFTNSGAEANEAAIKLSRKYGKLYKNGAFGIITATNSFHGRTMSALAATGQEHYQRPFTPLPPGFSHVPFNSIEAIRGATTEQTVAVMLEPVQGESGIHPADSRYLQDVRRWCDEQGLLMILDEIQSGVGRTGTFIAAQGYGVTADIVTLAKGLCGGLPCGAVLANGRASCFEPGDHGSTVGGNPLVCAAGIATLKVIVEEDLMCSATAVGKYFLLQLQALSEKFPAVQNARGRGLMLAFDLPDGTAAGFVGTCRDRGLLVNNTGTGTVRIVPPLILRVEQVDEAVAILYEAVALL